LLLCGRKRPGLTFKSFRHYVASLGRASGHPDSVLLDYLGVRSLKTLAIYAHSHEGQIRAFGEFVRNHYLAVVKGERPVFILTLTEAVRLLKEFISTENAQTQQQLEQLRKDIAAMIALLQHANPVLAHAQSVSPDQQQLEAA
jgi:hypothetical protein